MNSVIAEFILAIVQGIAEWFPISSKGHLVLVSYLLDYPNTLQFDVALHFGTLMAVFVYFGKDIVDIIEDILKGKWKSSKARMGFLLIVATIPAAVVGYIFRHFVESIINNLAIAAMGFAITALVLFIASLDFKSTKQTGFKQAFLIGCSQTLALLPGISRSGTTIASGLLLGLDEKQAVRFSFLMAIPIIFGAGILEIGNNTLPPHLLWATLVSFIVGLATIHILLKIVGSSRKNLRWFGLYALLVALALGLCIITGIAG
ncbi:undecaprenyl-diphosphate phosphatase [Candidatus Pacearchaeota archaeon]|nr:undecaprenyl-diphosphate phosphatase [Candidatus Pacearchaeota archaeon]